MTKTCKHAVHFTEDYPYKPPTIKLNTPNGKFAPGHYICLPTSSHHPDKWNPSLQVKAVLVSFLNLLSDNSEAETSTDHGVLSPPLSSDERRQLAYKEC